MRQTDRSCGVEAAPGWPNAPLARLPHTPPALTRVRHGALAQQVGHRGARDLQGSRLGEARKARAACRKVEVRRRASVTMAVAGRQNHRPRGRPRARWPSPTPQLDAPKMSKGRGAPRGARAGKTAFGSFGPKAGSRASAVTSGPEKPLSEPARFTSRTHLRERCPREKGSPPCRCAGSWSPPGRQRRRPQRRERGAHRQLQAGGQRELSQRRCRDCPI